MPGLTQLGVYHTAIGLIAVAAGIFALARHYRIDPRRRSGQIYLVTTLVTVVTGFFIFQHGGFGKPHALGVLTLVVLGIAALAGRTSLFGRRSPYVETISWSTSFFFHFIPGITETFTRLPLGAPLASFPEAPVIQGTLGVLFAVFLVGLFFQVRWLKSVLGATGQPVVAPAVARGRV